MKRRTATVDMVLKLFCQSHTLIPFLYLSAKKHARQMIPVMELKFTEGMSLRDFASREEIQGDANLLCELPEALTLV